jgi:hypothetical protein
METQPHLRADRFEQLHPGDLFIFPFENGPGFALKAFDPAPDGGKFLVPMGPCFPPDDLQPRLMTWQAETTISFGNNLILELSSAPRAWSVEEPGREIVCCVLAGENAYLRANHARSPGRFERCWILVTSGAIS